jgi:hypothetical protein
VAKCFALQLDGGGWHKHSTKLEALDELIYCGIRAATAICGRGAGCRSRAMN